MFISTLDAQTDFVMGNVCDGIREERFSFWYSLDGIYVVYEVIKQVFVCVFAIET